MNSSLNSASPVICTSGRISTPSCSMSIRKYVSPRCLGASGLVRASSMHHLDWCANVVHTFWPVTTYSSPSRTARVFSDARSEPDSGSLKPWHQISSALRIGDRKRSFWSSVPWAITVGPPIVSPSTFAICGARARANSSKKIACSICVAPAPPYSVGQVSPAQPRSLSLRCQSRRKSNDSSSPSGSRPGWCSAIQRPQRVAELLLGRRKRQVHAAETNTLSGSALLAGRRGAPDRAPAWAARRSPRRPGSAPGPATAATVIGSSRKIAP